MIAQVKKVSSKGDVNSADIGGLSSQEEGLGYGKSGNKR